MKRRREITRRGRIPAPNGSSPVGFSARLTFGAGRCPPGHECAPKRFLGAHSCPAGRLSAPRSGFFAEKPTGPARPVWAGMQARPPGDFSAPFRFSAHSRALEGAFPCREVIFAPRSRPAARPAPPPAARPPARRPGRPAAPASPTPRTVAHPAAAARRSAPPGAAPAGWGYGPRGTAPPRPGSSALCSDPAGHARDCRTAAS